MTASRGIDFFGAAVAFQTFAERVVIPADDLGGLDIAQPLLELCRVHQIGEEKRLEYRLRGHDSDSRIAERGQGKHCDWTASPPTLATDRRL